jgi:eukaryotic-like serine/threonine-protein kinase
MEDTSVSEGGAEVDRIRDEQRRRWQAGDHVLIEDYLRRSPDLNDSTEAVLDLIYGEYVLREEQGEQPRADDYYRRFPDLQPRLERLFRLDQALLKTPLPPLPETSVDLPAQARQTTIDHPGTAKPLTPGTLPRMIGKYPVVSALAEGGQGQVFRGVHPTLGRNVVIKLGRQPIPAEGPGRDRLSREGKMLAELDHPNLVRVYDFDVEDNRPFLVMECVVGRTLDQYLNQEKPTPEEAARLVAQAARALAFAHRRGITHLDVKPQNLLIDDKGTVRVVDFGLARLERYGEAAEDGDLLRGTVTYMAPEQARLETDRIGPRSDVYALGGVLYFLLVGQAPHTGRTFLDALGKAAKGGWDPGALERAKVPASLRAICRRAMALEPEQRYARAEDLADELEAFLARPRRRRMLLGIGLGIVLLAGLTLFLGRQTAPAPRPAEESAPCLAVHVWRGKGYLDVEKAIPVRTGDKVRIEATVPEGLFATLFVRSSEGKLLELSRLRTEAEPGQLSDPLDPNVATLLVGPAGTELVLLCARRDRPVTLEEMEPLGAWQTWEDLPPESVLRMTSMGVRVLGLNPSLSGKLNQPDPQEIENEEREEIIMKLKGGTRPRGPQVNQPNPEGNVKRKLELLRKRLVGMDLIEGLAYGHSSAP